MTTTEIMDCLIKNREEKVQKRRDELNKIDDSDIHSFESKLDGNRVRISKEFAHYLYDLPVKTVFDWAEKRINGAAGLCAICGNEDGNYEFFQDSIRMIENITSFEDDRNIQNIITSPIIPDVLSSYVKIPSFKGEPRLLLMGKKIIPNEKVPKKDFISLFSKKHYQSILEQNHLEYEKLVLEAEAYNRNCDIENEKRKKEHEKEIEKYKIEKKEYDKNSGMSLLNDLDNNYSSNASSIELYFYRVIDKIETTQLMNYKVAYREVDKTLIVDLQLPLIDYFGPIKRPFVVTRDKITLKECSTSYMDEIFINIFKQMMLRIMHDIFLSDTKSLLDSVCINAFYEGLSRATGKTINNCFAVLKTNKNLFNEVDLLKAEIDACFDYLGGKCNDSLGNIMPLPYETV